MRSGDQVPRVSPEASFSDLMREMSAKGLGCSAIVDAAGHIQASLPTATCAGASKPGQTCAPPRRPRSCTPSPRRIAPDALAVDAAE